MSALCVCSDSDEFGLEEHHLEELGLAILLLPEDYQARIRHSAAIELGIEFSYSELEQIVRERSSGARQAARTAVLAIVIEELEWWYQETQSQLLDQLSEILKRGVECSRQSTETGVRLNEQPQPKLDERLEIASQKGDSTIGSAPGTKLHGLKKKRPT